jgi:hypothetical protein
MRLSGTRSRPTISQKKSDSAWNRTRTSEFVVRNFDHETTEAVALYFL